MASHAPTVQRENPARNANFGEWARRVEREGKGKWVLALNSMSSELKEKLLVVPDLGHGHGDGRNDLRHNLKVACTLWILNNQRMDTACL